MPTAADRAQVVRAGNTAPGDSTLRLTFASLAYLFVFLVCFTAWIPIALDIRGLHLRSSQLLLPVVLLLASTQKSRFPGSPLSRALVVAGGLWWSVAVVCTLLNVPSAPLVKPLGRVLLLGLNMLHAVAIYLLVVRLRETCGTLLSLLVSVALLNGAFLLVAAGAHLGMRVPRSLLAHEDAPMLVAREIAGGTTLRFVFGGVVAGCVSAGAFVLAVSLILLKGCGRRRTLLVCAAMAGVGLVLGFSRQGVVSLAGGLGVVASYLLLRGRIVALVRGVALLGAVGLVVCGGVGLTPGGRSFLQAFAGRTALLVEPDSYTTGTVFGRTALWSGMWQEIAENPLVGRGQDAYLKHMVNPGEEGSHNFPLETLHSAGLLGFVLYLIVHVAPLLAAVRLLARGSLASRASADVLAVLGAYVAVLLASLTNLIFWNPAYWVVLGLLVAATRRAQAERRGDDSCAGGRLTSIEPATTWRMNGDAVEW